MKLWIARDYGRYGDLCIFTSKPYQDADGIWTNLNQDYICIDNKLFPEVTFENSPQQVEVKLVKEE